METDIIKANEQLEAKKQESANLFAWLRNRFGDTPNASESVVITGKEKLEKDDDDDEDDDDDKKEAMASAIMALSSRIESSQRQIDGLHAELSKVHAQIEVLSSRMSGDPNPVIGRGGQPTQNTDIQQLHSHQQVQATLPTAAERQAYGIAHIAPLQKKLGRLS